MFIEGVSLGLTILGWAGSILLRSTHHLDEELKVYVQLSATVSHQLTFDQGFHAHQSGLHRGRKGIFNCFSKFSKFIFDLSGLIDQNESENSNFIP